jgi:hypothetical protein
MCVSRSTMSGREPEAGAYLELLLIEERAALDAIHGAAITAMDEGGLADDVGTVALVAAAGIVAAPIAGRPHGMRGREPYDAGANAPLDRLGPC